MGSIEAFVNVLNEIKDFSELNNFIKKYELIRDNFDKKVLRVVDHNKVYYCKIWIEKGLKREIINLIRRGNRGSREVKGLNRLLQKGFCVPNLVSSGSIKFSKFSIIEWVITEEVNGYVGLDKLLYENKNIDKFSSIAANALYKIHNIDLIYGDYNFENILINTNGEVCFLDWLGVRESASVKKKLKDVSVSLYEITANSTYPNKHEINGIFLKSYLKNFNESQAPSYKKIILSYYKELLRKKNITDEINF